MTAKVALEQERRPLQGCLITIGISKDTYLPKDMEFRIEIVRDAAREINKNLGLESSVFRKWECTVSRKEFFPHMHYVCADVGVEQIQAPKLRTIHFHKVALESAQEIRNAIQYLYKPEVAGLEYATQDMVRELVSRIANVRAFWRTGFFAKDIPRKSGAQFCATCGGEYRMLEESDVGGGNDEHV